MGFDFSKFYCILLLLQMILFSIARVAQGIEQQFPKLLVGGSIPLSGTIFSLKTALNSTIRYRLCTLTNSFRRSS